MTAPFPSPGTLYVVATPIGHPEDITLRALRVLAAVDLIAAEDTRETGQLLAHHGIQGHLTAYHEHNEARKTPELIARIQAGISVAVVSDAGTPSVSDPGFRLVRAALAAGLPVVPVPGASAAITALSVAGLATDAFVFLGFPPRKGAARRRLLERLAPLSETLIFYESPRRITALIADLIAVCGDRQAVLGREMTKTYEEFLRGSLGHLHRLLSQRPAVHGEVTLLVAGAGEAPEANADELRAILAKALADEAAAFSQVVQDTARRLALPRRRVYQLALEIKHRRAGD
jgi:16S rRNA (cytidine1402-2'-O)-methyltransferase